jgi:sarcosine oxidase, subunit gamma
MSEPMMQSPLHAFNLAAQARPMDASCGVWASELPLLGYLSLRGRSADHAFTEAVARVVGVALPTKPCTLAATGTAKILWISPDEWMIVCPRARLRALFSELSEALANVKHQVADNSGGYTQVSLQGKNARDLLSHTSVYDLAALIPGRVVGTTFGKSSIYMYRHEDGYCLVLRRSFADYIWRYLVRAAEPYGLGVAQIDAAAIAGDAL